MIDFDEWHKEFIEADYLHRQFMFRRLHHAGGEIVKGKILKMVSGCLVRDATLQKLVKQIEEMK